MQAGEKGRWVGTRLRIVLGGAAAESSHSFAMLSVGPRGAAHHHLWSPVGVNVVVESAWVRLE